MMSDEESNSIEHMEDEELDDFYNTDFEGSDGTEDMDDFEADVDIDGSRNSSSVSQSMCKNCLIF